MSPGTGLEPMREPPHPPSRPVLTVTDLYKSHRAAQVLQGVSLAIAESEVLAVVGASGSGKTTLLRCIGALEQYERGRIELQGEEIGYRSREGKRRRLSDAELAAQRARIGIVFQHYNLFPHLTAAENIMLGLRRVLGKSRREAKGIAEHWLKHVGLADHRDRYPNALSGGEKQRVAIARAIAMSPRLILFDEVTSALDPESVGGVLRTIGDLAASGVSMLIVSHEMAFVREVGTRVAFMEAGRITECGPVDEVFRGPSDHRFRSFLSAGRQRAGDAGRQGMDASSKEVSAA